VGFFNIVITMIVGAVLLVGAGITFSVRMAERDMQMEQDPMAVLTAKRGEGYRAPLPKWDDKNYKGLEHKGGTFRSASSPPK
jgi:hypothetical protein